MQLASPNPLFFIFSIPFKKVQLLAQQAAPQSCLKGQHLLQAI